GQARHRGDCQAYPHGPRARRPLRHSQARRRDRLRAAGHRSAQDQGPAHRRANGVPPTRVPPSRRRARGGYHRLRTEGREMTSTATPHGGNDVGKGPARVSRRAPDSLIPEPNRGSSGTQTLARSARPVLEAYRAQLPAEWSALSSRPDPDAGGHRSAAGSEPRQREGVSPGGVTWRSRAADLNAPRTAGDPTVSTVDRGFWVGCGYAALLSLPFWIAVGWWLWG